MPDDELETGVVDEVIDQSAEEQADEKETAEPEQELEDITIGDAEAPAAKEAEQDSTAIRAVREAHREEQRKRKELERRLAEAEEKAKPAQEPVPVVSTKPKLEDFDYDGDQYADALEKWHEQKSAKQAYEARQRAAQEDQQRQEQEVLNKYRAAADALPVDKVKYKAAEAEIRASFEPIQLAVLLKSKIPERLVYAVGNNPAKLDELAAIKDPIALAYELGRTEKSLTSTKQTKSAPPPDRPLGGAGGGSAAVLEKLEREAERTGDRSKLIRHKKQLKSRAA